MKTLIIAEKPSVAGNIATALGASNRKEGYFEGNGYFVTYAFGHLYTLASTEAYDPNIDKWDLEHFPVIPDQFKYVPIDDKGVKAQLKTIKALAADASLIINACDADREGELIFAEIYNNLQLKNPVKRLWETAQTPKAIQKGMEDLKGHMRNLENAGYNRQWVDWLLGINLTVLFTVKCGDGTPLKVGRVVLPTLKLIFDRDMEINNFAPAVFYTLKCDFKHAEGCYTGQYIDDDRLSRFPSADTLKSIVKAIGNTEGVVSKYNCKETFKNPPPLFSLTDLQGFITDRHKGFTADKVLKVLQTLYENKYVSYPRTASRYLDDAQKGEAEEVYNAILKSWGNNAIDLSSFKYHTLNSIFDSTKVDSHPAITPTYIAPKLDALSADEHIIYDAIVYRFMSHFLPAATYKTVEITTSVNGHQFMTSGNKLTSKGWLILSTKDPDVDSEDHGADDEIDNLPSNEIIPGTSVDVIGCVIKEGKTTSPAHYTERSLLVAMETCGKDVEDETTILKGFTIGTPATRADTIKKMIDAGYTIKSGKYLKITTMGAKIITAFPIKRILKVEFTGKIEKTLKDIENGDYDSDEFMIKMKAFTQSCCEEIKKAEEVQLIGRDKIVVGPCPRCHKNVIETPKTYSCESGKEGCGFAIWKDNKFFSDKKKKLTNAHVSALLKKGKVKISELYSAKSDKKYSATVVLEDTGTFVNFKLEF